MGDSRPGTGKYKINLEHIVDPERKKYAEKYTRTPNQIWDNLSIKIGDSTGL